MITQLKKFLLGVLSLGLVLTNVSCNEDDPNTDEETTYVVSISGTTATSEGGNGASVTIALNENNSTGGAISIPYSVSGTATSGSDYTALSGSASIADGSNQAVINVNITDDQDVENDETIIISLSTTGLPSNVDIGTSNSLTITISDNDEEAVECTADNSTDQNNDECDHTYEGGSSYSMSVNGSTRTINSSGIPNHDYGNQFDEIPNQNVQVTNQNFTFNMALNPTANASTTSILNPTTLRPQYKFGVALNGVPIDPAPAEPFIFEDGDGEFVWEWVYEPNNNMEAVGLDCAVAHVQPDGAYHYHGDMAPLAELYWQGISTGTAPSSSIQIGWAADGFPIVYRYGPTANGSGVELLESSYQLKSGNRTGDGVDEPCGEYNGKYTNDYEWVSGAGDLDECNGISRNITIGEQSFNYFYVITEDFPVISRCLVGTPNSSFQIGAN